MIQDTYRTVTDLLYEKNLWPHLILEDYLHVKPEPQRQEKEAWVLDLLVSVLRGTLA